MAITAGSWQCSSGLKKGRGGQQERAALEAVGVNEVKNAKAGAHGNERRKHLRTRHGGNI